MRVRCCLDRERRDAAPLDGILGHLPCASVRILGNFTLLSLPGCSSLAVGDTEGDARAQAGVHH